MHVLNSYEFVYMSVCMLLALYMYVHSLVSRPSYFAGVEGLGTRLVCSQRCWLLCCLRKLLVYNCMFNAVEPLLNGHFEDKEFCLLQGGVRYWECLILIATRYYINRVFVAVTSGMQPPLLRSS